MFATLRETNLIMPPELCYYRQRLSADEQRVYDMICQAISGRKRRTLFPAHFRFTLSKVFNAITHDQSMFFYLSKDGMRSRTTVSHCVVSWNFMMTESEIDDCIRRMDERIREFALFKRETALRYELRVHNLLQDMNLVFDSDGLGGHWEEHCILGPLLLRRTVCEGAAHLFRLLCSMRGVYCLCVSGVSAGLAPSRPHMWNLIRLGNAYAHVDVYWDCMKKMERINAHCYSYFNLSDSQIKLDHVYAQSELPLAPTEKYSYFAVNHADISNMAEYRLFLQKANERNKRNLIMRLGNRLNVDVCTREICSFPWTRNVTGYTYVFDRAQRVLYVTLTDNI